MFIAFFYLLRQRGLNVSLDEWITLLEGMEKGLHHSSLTGFYHLCRAVVVKSEVEYDRFDQVFLEFFGDVPFNGELPEEMQAWLNAPGEDLKRTLEQLGSQGSIWGSNMEELLQGLEQRLKAQKEEHNGGRFWVGTQGHTPWGNRGRNPRGIRIGGEGGAGTAMSVAGERKFRDFRKDNKLDSRAFQMAFRMLRQLSSHEEHGDKELDVDATIHDTCDSAGNLKIRYQNPRKNTVKVLLMMDSGGSMAYYSRLCSMLFQAATKANHFKELKIYYFHNCISCDLFTDPKLGRDAAIPTEWVLENLDNSYRVIVVSDARMNPSELWEKQFNWETGTYGPSGMEWLERFKKQFPHLIWLNPEPTPSRCDYRTETHCHLAGVFDMYPLTVEGLEQGVKRLLVKQ